MKKQITLGRICVWLALTILMIFFILHYTIFTRDIGAIRIFKGPFWELKNHMWKDIGLNILLFVPFGVMIGWKFGLKGVVAGFFISVMIEAIQYTWSLGYTEVDDVINNTIGTGIGCCIGIVCKYWLKRVNQDLQKQLMNTSDAVDLKSPQKLSDNHSVFIGISNQYSNLPKVIDDHSDSNQSKDKQTCRE